jgi:hypothetical protein
MKHILSWAALALSTCTAAPVAAQSVTIAPPPTWRACVAEGGTCASRAGALVRYGAGDRYTHRVVNGAVKCDNATFGDPIEGVVKTCAIASPASPAAVTKPVVAPTPAPAPVPTPAPSPTGTPDRAKLGVNVAGVIYWSGEPTFANQAMAAEWRDPSGGWGYVPADRLRDGIPVRIDDGHPLTTFLSPPVAAFRGEDALTRCTWGGTGRVGISGARRIDAQDAGSVTFAWPKTTAGGSVRLDLLATSTTDPVRDLDCRLTTDPADAVFAPQLLDYLRPFGVLRFLDWTSANGNPASVTWATRGVPRGIALGGSDGVAIEYQIALANAVKASPWFTVPLNADADYHRRMARMVHDAVPAGRRVYVELSNEVWNYQFGQTRQAEAEGLAAKLSENGFQAALYRYGQRITEVMPIWAEVFADRPRDLVRVVATQSGNPWVGQVLMEWNGAAIAKHVDAIAIAPYFFADVSTLTDDHETNMRLLAEAADREIAGPMKAYKALADRYAKLLIAYEGGQHQIDPANVARRERMQRDTRMEGIYRRYLAGWRAAGGDTFTLYSATGPISQYGAWGLREYAGQPLSETPKLRGVLDASAAK